MPSLCLHELQSRALLSCRTLCDGECSLSALFNIVAASHMWQLSTQNVANATEELNFHFIYSFKSKFIWYDYLIVADGYYIGQHSSCKQISLHFVQWGRIYAKEFPPFFQSCGVSDPLSVNVNGGWGEAACEHGFPSCLDH